MSAGSQFSFLQSEWPEVFEAAAKAEALALVDPRTACFYARRALEIGVTWLYTNDDALKLPYQQNLSALIHEPTFKTAAGPAVFNKAVLITRYGNQAVHSHRAVKAFDALTTVRELFHICFWLTRTYARGARPADDLAFEPDTLPKSAPVPTQTQEQLQKLAAQLAEKDKRLAALFADKETLSKELAQARQEIAAIKKRNAATPDQHDYSEAQTRDAFIDLLLKEAGWPLNQPRDREVEVSGMPNQQKKGYVDYVLWGDDGRPLAVVEAKRTRKSAAIGQQQAKLYADCLEQQFGRRPVIFCSNGYEHWLWDDALYPPRPVQGFRKKDELELMILRRQTRTSLAGAAINPAIVERYYQTRAIRRIGEAFEADCERKALVVMATGAGKTRTVIALCDLLMRCNWVKRVLFLADRTALVNQAVNAFKRFLPEASPVNLVTEPEAAGRVFVSTYPTMMGLIDETKDGQRRFGTGHFDLVIIDEAHRSVYQKYGAIFRYFDSLLVGLTATPREEIDRDTYGLFDLEKGVPTDAYDLKNAVADKFLVPAKAVSVPLKFQRDGIKYEDLSEEEKEQWDGVEWDEEGTTPQRVEPEAVNKWLFNKDTVDKVLEHLMTHGQTVAGGDRLGKTIVFAKNKDHAEFIAQRFDVNYPHLKGAFARVIHCGLPYAQSLIDDFSNPAKMPHIAISVDMLDTGIDVPEVVNLVFFKLVRSKTKFWQMIGRGTRLCPDLFGPGKHKAFFYIFDYCQNLEFFSQHPETTAGALGASLSKRIFTARLEVIGELDRAFAGMSHEPAEGEAELGHELRAVLQTEVAAMNVDNFVVRPQRRLVERFAKPEAWVAMDSAARGELAYHVAGLPTELDPEEEEAKRFDLLILNLQLAVLRNAREFERLKNQVIAIAGLLEEKAAIPMIQAQLARILEVQTEGWWTDVTLPMLEQTRKRLRSLVKLIDKRQRKPIYTDFEDSMAAAKEVVLADFVTAENFEKFREKVRAFLRAHQSHLTIQKLRMNEPLTAVDLAELERVLAESGVATPEQWETAKAASDGLGLFVRSLVGLDREAAKQALNAFTAGKILTANQLEFVNMVVDQLTERGVVEPKLLYESPFTDVNAQGPDGVFDSSQVDELLALLEQVRERAVV
ncbi:DEAD/DEAH box helicase family protein [Opitutus terrae]|uniref:Type III restriction protein res subunit n=1 Tax=Opitutus terrae (strain DSM 11246 / JCM 15787 / PB90-1) TaxID=452637 RepID=B1ZYW2_OPITP|nr:DEAD/DEAH box helicase family protein [Opitutus terrae]ACB76285.1 type III restriction protein res subunit [Opitutus terrae PB90-1]